MKQRIIYFFIFTLMATTGKVSAQVDSTFIYLYDAVYPLVSVPGSYVIRYEENQIDEINSGWFDENFSLVRMIDAGTVLVEANEEYIAALDKAHIVSIQKLYRFTDVPPEDEFDSAEVDTSNPDDMNMYAINEILVKPFDESQEDFRAEMTLMGLDLEETNNAYWTVRIANDANIVETAKNIHQIGLTKFAYPNMFRHFSQSYIPPDPYFAKQYYLNNTGQAVNYGVGGTANADMNAPEAWDITKGSFAIKVAVVDGGITANHPDLPSSRQIRLPGSNAARGYNVDKNTSSNSSGWDPAMPSWSDPGDPSPNLFLNDGHGNACAGIIGATHNSEGVSGIAPLCRIIPIKVPLHPVNYVTENVYAQQIIYAQDNGAAVISNSWNTISGVPGTRIPIPSLEEAIIGSVRDGRGGRGSVVVFCSGNRNDMILRPANADIEGLICVGGSDKNDNRVGYSPAGIAMDIVAPTAPNANGNVVGFNADVWTMDIPGDPGYNPWNDQHLKYDRLTVGTYLPSSGTNFDAYTGLANGTSMSAPQVAGVAALMLSINPCMYASEVETVLKRNADKVGGFDYGWNSSVPGHSLEFGYGRLNAYRALVDMSYEQNVNYRSFYAVKSGSIQAGRAVTNAVALGNVVVKSKSTVIYRGVLGVEMTAGFETEPNSTFTAEVIPVQSDCWAWDDIPMNLLDQQFWIKNAQLITQNPNPNTFLHTTNTDHISLMRATAEAKEAVKENEVLIFPNPNVQSDLKVSFKYALTNDATVEMYDVFGERVLAGRLGKDAQHTDMNLSRLAQGMYTLVARFDGKVVSKRVIKL